MTSKSPGGWDSVMMWCFRLLLVLCVTLLFLDKTAAQASGEPASVEPITIAAVFSMSGLAARHNMPLVEMIKIVVDHINDEGGVLGRKIHLRILDNKSTPIGSLEAAKEAIAAHVTAVIGAHWSSHSLAMAPLLQQAGIPMITPASTNPAVTVGRDYIFRISFIDSMQGMAMARFAREELKLKTAAVLRNVDEQYSLDLAGFFSDAFSERGGRVVFDTGYRGNATDYSSIIEELLLLKPEAIYIPGYTRDTALFMKQARKMGITSTFLGGDAWDLLDTLIAETVEGSYQSVAWHPDVPYQASRDMQESFLKYSDTALRNMSMPLAYDAVMLLADAIRRAGGTDQKKIRDALAATHDFPGATGPISFNAEGDPQDKEVIIVKYVQGETVYTTAVKP